MSEAETEKTASRVDELFQSLEGLSVLELAELKSRIEEEWGVSVATAPAMGGGGGGAQTTVATADGDEPSSFDVVLTDAGAQKIQVIKLVREVSGLGLKEAKAVADDLGTVKAGLNRDEAEALLGRIEEAGAQGELKPAA